jgi:ketosteroid isomerase-like protein
VEDENRKLLERSVEALNKGNEEALVALWHEDAELYGFPGVPDAPDVYRGHEGLRAWLANLTRTFDDISYESREVALKGDVGVIELAASAKGAGSGVPIEWTAFVVAHVREGKVVRAEPFTDRDEAFEVAGFEA